MSKINAVGNTAATSNEQIVTGLENAAAAMAVTGTSFEQTVALFTAGQEITQDASKTGNALRSIAMRVRGYDEETNQLSADLVELKGEVVDLTKVASNNFQGISLFTDDTQTQYKEVGDYLKEIASIWEDIGAKDQQTLLEKLFGKNRASVGAAILKNIDAYDKALVTMATSAGSAEREMETASEAISFHLNELKETWVGVAQDIFQRDTVNVFVDALTSVSNVLVGLLKPIELVSSGIGLLSKGIGGLGTIATIAVAALSTQNIGRDKMFSLIKYADNQMCSVRYDSFHWSFVKYTMVNEATICWENGTT